MTVHRLTPAGVRGGCRRCPCDDYLAAADADEPVPQVVVDQVDRRCTCGSPRSAHKPVGGRRDGRMFLHCRQTGCRDYTPAENVHTVPMEPPAPDPAVASGVVDECGGDGVDEAAAGHAEPAAADHPPDQVVGGVDVEPYARIIADEHGSTVFSPTGGGGPYDRAEREQYRAEAGAVITALAADGLIVATDPPARLEDVPALTESTPQPGGADMLLDSWHSWLCQTCHGRWFERIRCCKRLPVRVRVELHLDPEESTDG